MNRTLRAMVALTIAGAAILGVSGTAQAAPHAITPIIPMLPHFGTDWAAKILANCDSPAPKVKDPTQGLSGIMTERPATTWTNLVPEHIYSNGGLAGLNSRPNDITCDMGIGDALALAKNSTDELITTALVGGGLAITATADTLDRRVWDPSWITAFLKAFADRVMGTLTWYIFIPFIVIGLLAASILLTAMARKGRISEVAAGTGWAVFVLIIATLFITSPLKASQAAQGGGEQLRATLTNSSSGVAGVTDQVTYAIHYQGFLRRSFCGDTSGVAAQYGPRLLEATRISYDQGDKIAASGGKLTPTDVRITQTRQWLKFADQIKKDHPDVADCLMHQHGTSGFAFVEFASSAFSGILRIMADLTVILAVVGLLILGIVFTTSAPYTVTPKGETLGRNILNRIATIALYLLASIIGFWIWTIWLLVALAPGISGLWSLILIIIGFIPAWSLLRPDRKILSLATFGRVDGSGQTAKFLKRAALTWIGGHAAGKAAGNALKDEDDTTPEPVRSEDFVAPEPPRNHPDEWLPPAPQYAQPIGPEHVRQHGVRPAPAGPAAALTDGPVPVQGIVIDPEGRDTLPAANGGTINGEGRWVEEFPGRTRTLTGGNVPYQRPLPTGTTVTPTVVTPTVQPGADVTLYQRPLDYHPDNQQVDCPWCAGSGCGYCENDGSVPKWVADEITDQMPCPVCNDVECTRHPRRRLRTANTGDPDA